MITIPKNPLLRALLPLLLLLSVSTSQVPATLEGSWQGTLDAGSAKLRLVFTFSKSPGGDYKAILESLDQGSTIPSDKVTVTGDKVRADFDRVHGFFEGSISKDGSELAGTWTQGGSLPLTLKRVQSAAAATKESPAKENAGAKPAAPEKPFTSPIDVVVPMAPTAFQANGKTHLVYELHITSFSSTTTLSQVEVLSDTGNSLARLEQADLPTSVMLVGNREATGTNKLTLGPGQMIVVYLWLTLENAAKIPATLEHKITVKAGKDQVEVTAQGMRVPVNREIAAIGAPLRGDNWVAANGPSNTSGHRRALIPINGHAGIAQRFAIDWVRMNPDGDGQTFKGDPLNNKNYRAYGSDALAVAEGTITEVKDGIPENVPGENSRAVPITLETVGGNHVILDIGHGRYALYAHLQPGSLKVKLGDHVKRGQVLGLVGNSGNSTEPHLHFHITDASSPLGAEGIPYELESFQAKKKPSDPLTPHKLEMPTEDEIVTFEK